MSRLPQAAEAVKFIGIGPADDPPAVAWHLANHSHPTALDPGEQGVLRHLQLASKIDGEPLVLAQGLPGGFGPLAGVVFLGEFVPYTKKR